MGLLPALWQARHRGGINDPECDALHGPETATAGLLVVIMLATKTSRTACFGHPRTVTDASNRDHGSTEMRGRS